MLAPYPVRRSYQQVIRGKKISWDNERVFQTDRRNIYLNSQSNAGEPLAVLDLAWPSGLHEGFSQPVALLSDEPEETERAVNRMGYRHFTDPENFREYVLQEILALEEADAAVS